MHRRIIAALLGGVTLVAAAAVLAPAAMSAGATKAPFYTVTGGSSDNVTTTEAGGSVNFNAPSGNVALIINGNVKALAPNFEYAVWVRALPGYTGDSLTEYAPLMYFKLGTFTTNGQGHGSFHFNILASELPAGTYDLQVAINDAGPNDAHIGSTVIATKKSTVVTVG
jgi:hypothetical protein